MREHGFLEGETCGRNGCAGVIAERATETGCSCHINPPCSHCTTPREYCPFCDWDAEDDTVMEEGRITFDLGHGFVHVERKPRVLDRSKIDYVIQTHSNSSQKVVGVYPPGTTQEEVRKLVDGTFGGRFEKFSGGDFVFIAYTD